MNDNPLPKVQPILGNPEIILFLESALAAAKAGQIVGLAVVAVQGQNAISAQAMGAFPAELHVGCHKLAGDIIASMFAKRSAIVMPQRRM